LIKKRDDCLAFFVSLQKTNTNMKTKITEEKWRQKAIQRIEGLLVKNGVSKEYFEKHYVGISVTVNTYRALKKVFLESKINLNENDDFMTNFSWFYGIGRFVSPSFRNNYFGVMQELRHKTEYSPRKLAARIKDGNKYQFSFTTKMLNMMNDAKYPIYDSNVAAALGLSSYWSESKDTLDSYIEAYEIITDTYTELLPTCAGLIRDFREVFCVPSTEVSDMRILDIIVWKLGAELSKK
jgi:hypothetical protein